MLEKECNNISNNQFKILEVTEKLIIEKGIEKTTLSDIAKEVGISKGTLYYYYSSKNELINDIAERYFNYITQTLMESMENLDKDSNVVQILQHALDEVLKSESMGKLHFYLVEEATRNEFLKEKFNCKYAQWKLVIEEGLRRIMRNKKLEFDVLSSIIVAALDGFIIQKILNINNINVDLVAQYLVKTK